jgi:hypothetical protein
MFNKLESLYNMFKKMVVTIITPPKEGNSKQINIIPKSFTLNTPLIEPLLKK